MTFIHLSLVIYQSTSGCSIRHSTSKINLLIIITRNLRHLLQKRLHETQLQEYAYFVAAGLPANLAHAPISRMKDARDTKKDPEIIIEGTTRANRVRFFPLGK